MNQEKIFEILNQTVDNVNELKKISFNLGDVPIEMLQTVSIILNALRRYIVYLSSEKKGDLQYALELLKTANDSLLRSIRQLEKKLR